MFLLFSSISLFPQAHFANGAVAQKLDYLPFGSERVNVKYGAFETRFTRVPLTDGFRIVIVTAYD